MNLEEIRRLLDGEFLTGTDAAGSEVTACMGTDMMSDVLAFAEPGALLVTGLTNSQSVRTANIADAAGIVYVRGKRPDPETVMLARRMRIPLISTELSMFETCGMLSAAGLRGIC